jgi:type IV pilus assembly protein PilC
MAIDPSKFSRFSKKPAEIASSKKETVSKKNQFQKRNYKFFWQGNDAEYNKTKGIIFATSLAIAKNQLATQGIKISRIKKEAAIIALLSRKPIKIADITRLTRQLATMITSGIPIIQCFDIVSKSNEHAALNDLILNLKSDVQSGTKLSYAMQRYPKYFNQLYCALIEAGEESGALGTMLSRLATYMEKIESIKRKIKKALFYPTAVVMVGIVVSGILLIKVIPEFKSLFANFNAKLPSFTLWVLNLSDWTQRNVSTIFITTIIVIVLHIFGLKKSYRYRFFVDKTKLKIPVMGIIFNKSILARFARTLATTFAAGMPLINALKVVAKAPGNLVYEEAILHARTKVTEGKALYSSLEAENLFPMVMLQMIAIGEESGELDEMLNKTAKVYEEEVDTAVDALSSLIEPLIMSILGVLVGGLVIAMYLPIFQLSSVMN